MAELGKPERTLALAADARRIPAAAVTPGSPALVVAERTSRR